ncbi:MAG: hypothetical protein HC802_17705 [Caldilineaceae bacterium]|nr:hypothetical protein [Caldilineaceae bacterium]
MVAAWAAQNRVDVDKALLVAPSFGIASLDPSRYPLYANLLARMPNRFEWWDPERKDERNGPTHAYAGYSTRGIATLLHLSLIVQSAARRRAPAARAITVFTNPSDEVVRNEVTAQVVENWRRNGASIHTHECPADWKLIHDLMDVQQEEQQVEIVYPELIELMVGDA